jgi:hypothetical protein
VSTSGGFGPLSYDWKKNDVVIKHDPTLFFASLDLEDSGSYSVSVSDSFDDTVESAPAEVIVKSTGVPAMNSLGLGIIIALAVLSGALALRRRQ